MNSSSIANIVNAVEDSQPAMIKLTVKGRSQHQYECTFREDEGPNFFLVFPPETLPESIDLEAEHLVAIARESSSLSLNASILEQPNSRTLHLQAKGLFDPASLREYFRINTSTEISASYRVQPQQSSGNWKISGQTLDMSGSGVLALFGDEPKNTSHIHVEIYLPQGNITVSAQSHIVRKKLLRNGKWQVSFHFDTISAKDRDSIITYLLGVQRKQLRENVRAFDE